MINDQYRHETMVTKIVNCHLLYESSTIPVSPLDCGLTRPYCRDSPQLAQQSHSGNATAAIKHRPKGISPETRITMAFPTVTPTNHAAVIKANEARIKALEAALAAAQAAPRQAPKITLKVSAKGAVSVYGMGRFPITLYAAQWLKLIGMSDEITKFIAANQSSLTSK